MKGWSDPNKIFMGVMFIPRTLLAGSAAFVSVAAPAATAGGPRHGAPPRPGHPPRRPSPPRGRCRHIGRPPRGGESRSGLPEYFLSVIQ